MRDWSSGGSPGSQSAHSRAAGAGPPAPSAAAGASRRPGRARRSAVRRASWPAASAGSHPTRPGRAPVSRHIRSANGTTRSSRCSASSTETPRSCTSRVSVASTSSAAVGSSADVGSSSTSSRGCMVSTEPIATRCCCAAGQGAQVAAAQVGDAEQVQGLLDPAAHRVRRQAELLHAVGELLLDGVGDEPGGRVLADVPDHVRALPRRRLDDADPVEQHVAVEGAAGEPRHQAGDHAEQRRLADPVGPDTSTSSPSSTVRSTSREDGLRRRTRT